MKKSVLRPNTSNSEPASQRAENGSSMGQGSAQLKSSSDNEAKSAAALLNSDPQAAAQRKTFAAIENSSLVRGQQSVAQKLSQSEPQLNEGAAQLAAQAKPKSNETGLPDNLKSGIESLSGMSMDGVKVHYNSDQPAQLNAHAFAQGTDIHVASGQEQHLPHEAWHVVQQAQGRVEPTRQMKDDVNVNDDVGLETEADVMGAKALASTAVQLKTDPIQLLVSNDELKAEKAAISGATSFKAIADVIDKSKAANKGESAIRLRNTENGIARAQAHFKGQKPPMVAEEQAFITSRQDDALADQRTGIVAKIDEALANTSPNTEVNYDKAQKGSTFGTHVGTVLAPELLSAEDTAATVEVAKEHGGLAKLVSLEWKPMDGDLKKLWIAAYGDAKLAESAWVQQSQTSGKLAIVPGKLGAVDPAKFNKYGDLATAFPSDMMGCMGFAEDYDGLTMSQAIIDFGLDAAWYPHGGYIITIPADQVAEATEKAKADGGTLGKASVFSSLMWSEFNYIVEDRAFNTTEPGDKDINKNAKQNSGIKAKDPTTGVELGKGEVTVKGFKAADFFKQSPKIIF